MHFSGEVSKSLQLKINVESRPKDDDIPGTAALREPIICQKSFQNDGTFVGFKQLNVPFVDIRNSEKSLRYFFPSSDENNINSRLKDSATLTNLVENSLNPDSKHSVEIILEQVKKLSTVQKLLLYLKLPSGKEVPSPLKQPTNPLGSRPEISQTIAWIKTHLRPEKETSLPKQDVYNEYQEYCSINQIKPLSTADFGKVMKQVYPNIRPRRLGTRGNSRYCYADSSFIQSCKISKQMESKKSLDGEKRKTEDDSNSTIQTPPERCKGKKARKGSSGSATKKSPLQENSSTSEAKKQRSESSPCVSTSKIKVSELPPIPALKRLKSNQPNKTGRESEFLENGNSLEQEEELLKYFQRPSPDDEPKVSQLRMLLERSKTDDKTARRRVSFEVVPESPNSQKKFSFVPISPISNSPFISPKSIASPQQRVMQRSSSVNCFNKGMARKEIPLLQNMMQSRYESGPSEINRSQSVPTTQLPQITPVPSEATDFDINTDTDSSNLLVMDDSSSSLMIDSTINNDNLNQILNIINEMDISKLSRSYPNTPTYTHDPIVSGLPADACKPIQESLTLAVQPREDEPHTNLFDDCSSLNIYCEGDALNNLAREVGRLDADVI
ncbi:hypothetical protein O3M35_010645 [Rhynocoris fuscipes]|uniref:RFX-type winged-helix domain-containing protein n=1 Tax=Rhynocoris fuscipes TaxID=488301 RepID=A0AAW1D152_9HEMI